MKITKWFTGILRFFSLFAVLAYLNTSYHLPSYADLAIVAVVLIWAACGYVSGLDSARKG